jgi:hypothetical protein
MKNVQLDGVLELNLEEQQRVAGGIGLVLLGALGGLYTMYNLGKIVGAEIYAIQH